MNIITKRIMQLTGLDKNQAIRLQALLDEYFAVDYSEAEQSEIDAAIFEAFTWWVKQQ